MALPVQVASLGLVTATDHNALIPYILHVREEQVSGTDAGAFSAGTWQKRLPNTVALNEITGASMTSGVITLPAGVYNVRGWASAFTVGRHKAKLRQTSVTVADLLIGSNENAVVASTNQSQSVINGRIALAGSTTLELQHQCTTTKTVNGLGQASTFGVNEVYSELIFTKVG